MIVTANAPYVPGFLNFFSWPRTREYKKGLTAYYVRHIVLRLGLYLMPGRFGVERVGGLELAEANSRGRWCGPCLLPKFACAKEESLLTVVITGSMPERIIENGQGLPSPVTDLAAGIPTFTQAICTPSYDRSGCVQSKDAGRDVC